MACKESYEQRSGSNDEAARGLSYLAGLVKQHGLPHELNLEGIASKGSSEGMSDGAKRYVGLMFSDKAKAEKAVIKQLLNEITLRENIHKDLLSRIDEDICQCKTFLHQIEAVTAGNELFSDASLAFGGRRTTFEAKVMDLERMKRDEELMAWRDLALLRRYLLFALKDYWAAARRRGLLSLGKENEDLAA